VCDGILIGSIFVVVGGLPSSEGGFVAESGGTAGWLGGMLCYLMGRVLGGVWLSLLVVEVVCRLEADVGGVGIWWLGCFGIWAVLGMMRLAWLGGALWWSGGSSLLVCDGPGFEGRWR